MVPRYGDYLRSKKEALLAIIILIYREAYIPS
jgi:hypothetical protein